MLDNHQQQAILYLASACALVVSGGFVVLWLCSRGIRVGDPDPRRWLEGAALVLSIVGLVVLAIGSTVIVMRFGGWRCTNVETLMTYECKCLPYSASLRLEAGIYPVRETIKISRSTQIVGKPENPSMATHLTKDRKI